MSVALCTVFKSEVPPHGTLGGDNTALAKGMARLDAVAAKNGLTTLQTFLSQDPAEAAQLAEMMGVDTETIDPPPEQWFSAQDGLTMVQGLIGLLRNQPTVITRGDKMLAELEEVAKELQAAVELDVKFHLAMVP